MTLTKHRQSNLCKTLDLNSETIIKTLVGGVVGWSGLFNREQVDQLAGLSAIFDIPVEVTSRTTD